MDALVIARIVMTGAFSLLLGGCGLADLRTTDLRKNGIDRETARKGDELLARMESTHGGVDKLRAFRTAEVDIEEHWPSGFYRLLLNSWPDDPQRYRLSWLIWRDEVRAELTSGKHTGMVSGVQNWCYYDQPISAAPKFHSVGSNRKLNLPTMAFWYELPLRIRQANVRAFAGQRSENGRLYDLLFATWNRAEPQKTIDQFILWIEHDTGRLAYVHLTVRDFAGWGEAFVSYDGWHDVDGILVPDGVAFRYGAGKPSASITRHVTTQNAQFGVDKPDSWFIPEPALKCEK